MLALVGSIVSAFGTQILHTPRGPMRKTAMAHQQSRFFSGWKEIATYMGKGVRTVQRYERDLGLPVRRPAGGTTGSVVATKAELDGWITASPIREAFKLTRHQPTSVPITASIKTGLAEMSRLREQMVELRSEVRSSVQLLRDGLYGLQSDLRVNSTFEKRPSTLLDATQRKSFILELLELASRQQAS